MQTKENTVEHNSQQTADDSRQEAEVNWLEQIRMSGFIDTFNWVAETQEDYLAWTQAKISECSMQTQENIMEQTADSRPQSAEDILEFLKSGRPLPKEVPATMCGRPLTEEEVEYLQMLEPLRIGEEPLRKEEGWLRIDEWRWIRPPALMKYWVTEQHLLGIKK